jgi:hypothetical protein
MSRVLPDPQIQSLRAMRAGDIAFALPNPAVMAVGVQSVALPLPTADVSIPTPAAVPSTPSLAGNPAEIGGPVGVAPATTLSQDAPISVTIPATVNTLVTVDGPFDPGTITVTVGKATSVV